MGLLSSITGFLTNPIAGIIGAGIDAFSASNEASKNRDFQAQMSNTSYQRAVADMKEAGLNPILAAKLGGASTPGGAMANLGTQAVSGVNSAQSAMTQETQRDLNETQMVKIEVEAEKIAVDLNLSVQQTENLKAQLPKIAAEILKIKADAGMTTALSAIPEAVSDLVRSIREYLGLGEQGDLERLYDRAVNAVKRTLNDSSGLPETIAPRMRQRRK